MTDDQKNIEKTSQNYELRVLEILNDQTLRFTLENQEALLGRDLKIEAMLYDKKNRLINIKFGITFNLLSKVLGQENLT